MNQKTKIVNIDKNEGSVTLSNGVRDDKFFLAEKPRQFMGKLALGEAEVSYTTEVDESGMPFISFIKNTGMQKAWTPKAAFNKAIGVQRENSEDRAITMLVAYVKDTALEIYKGAIAKNGMIEMDIAFDVATICVLKAYQKVKEGLK